MPTVLYSMNSNQYPHIFTTIISPVSKYNTSRNLTKSTFTTLKWYLDNNFEFNINFDYKLQFSFGTTNYYLYDDIKSYIRSIYLKIILTIEKNISNSNFKVYPLSTNINTNIIMNINMNLDLILIQIQYLIYLKNLKIKSLFYILK